VDSCDSHPRSASSESSAHVMSERSAASSPWDVDPLFAESHSPDACVPVLPVPAPGVSVPATSVGGPALPASGPPPLPATHQVTNDTPTGRNTPRHFSRASAYC